MASVGTVINMVENKDVKPVVKFTLTIEQLYTHKFTQHELTVAMFIARNTFGKQTESIEIRAVSIADQCGFDQSNCRKALKSLHARNVIERCEDEMWINLNFAEWETDRERVKSTRIKNGLNQPDKNTNGLNQPEKRVESTPNYSNSNYIYSLRSYMFPVPFLKAPQKFEKPEANSKPKKQTKKAAKQAIGKVAIAELLELWAEHFPEKIQPRQFHKSKERMAKAQRAWEACLELERKNGDPSYSMVGGDGVVTREGAIEFWRKVMEVCQQREFLTHPDSDWFKLDWLLKFENVMKIREGDFKTVRGNKNAGY